jgi:winged helix DNA-binding protein
LGRSKSFNPENLSKMEQRREVVRIPAMRQSIFLVPAKTAPRIFAATRLPMERHARRLRYAGLDWDRYARLKQRVLEHTQEPIAATALRKALPAEEGLMLGVRVMTSEGLVLRLASSLWADRLRYVATEAWLGRPLEEADPQQSLEWLAQEYLRAYGPARVEDFAWWSGAPRHRASAAIGEASVVDIGGGLLLPSDQKTDFDRVASLGPEVIDLLPKWDAYTMGHAPGGRQRLVDDKHVGSAYAASGDGLPLVLRGGRAVATWSNRFDGNRMLGRVIPFGRGVPPELYEHAFDEIGQLLGAANVEVVAGVDREESRAQ